MTYLNKRLSSISASTSWDDVAPGDLLDVATATWTKSEAPPNSF